METRLEKYKKLKKVKRINRLKRFCIIILLILLFLSLEIVNRSMVELYDRKDSSIINFDMETKELNIFGKTYIIDLSLFKNN